MNRRQQELEPLRDSWGMPVCFHKIECPVGTCTWTNPEFEAFVTNAISELEEHLSDAHRAKVHLTPHGRIDGIPLAHGVRCEVVGAIFDDGLLTDGELNLRIAHHRAGSR